MKVLLSIKPEFAEKIFEGEKHYEYRRVIFKNKDIKKIVVYASHPTQRVIGEFEVENILCDDINDLWKTTKKHGGITKEYFYKYFADKCQGYAIKIKNCLKYSNPLHLEESFGMKPPQSFAYLR